ncbi:prolyl oligopeptidase family serine peptidase [Streptococcus sp. S784/96/1]|uniref:prolyl oligopeptidase family serine peptidase n=1 Tax=Streptococcus sp. S784/96/1 TaxID=2653499 RepID=UPI00138993B8|nr:prolyl oligopeptidase family serine peptidase [Streptococcus sp. S784/96/1]
MEYITVTQMTENGPFITKLILPLPEEIDHRLVSRETFNVYVECRDKENEQILSITDRVSGERQILKGYPRVLGCYPSDAYGNEQTSSPYITLELAEERLNKRTVGTILESRYITNQYRITQTREITEQCSGLVYDSCREERSPNTEGWRVAYMKETQLELNYAYYQPTKDVEDSVLPLVIWLHGAGEGGQDPHIAYTGNRVTALSSRSIQEKLGRAWVLVPQCPTVWMDDGKDQLGRSNQSIYSIPLKKVIDDFISRHVDNIDKKRIYIGGLSNGGFMTLRMLLDYPDFFAGGIACCAPFYLENAGAEPLERLITTPLWFVHAKGDELVPPKETTLPLYHHLKGLGAANLHYTLYENVMDKTGRYKEADGRPRRYFSHGVWIYVYQDDPNVDFDGRKVIDQGLPVTLWEWIGQQSL